MPSTRRAVLVGAATAIAGCVSGDPPSSTPGDGTASPATSSRSTSDTTLASPESRFELGETAVVGDFDVRAYDARTQHSHFELVHPDFVGVVAPEGRQFVFLSVAVRGPAGQPAPAVADFAIAVGDRSYRAWSTGDSFSVPRDGRPYTADAREGWIGFELPAPIGDERIDLELQRGANITGWRLGGGVVTRLRRPAPDFEVRDFQGPTEVGSDEPIELSATVANVGGGAGTFRAALNQEGELLYGGSATEFEMEPGAERTWSDSVTTHQRVETDEEVTVHLRFRSAGGDVDHDVVVRPAEAGTG